ncbi:hypothetical protein Pst134EB_009941 [Puccinia striiformis f. sp. tritici]|nr:hypothetical protein Pst134EB_009941 [Puccinia striiformis f. sp. tritici]
MEMEVGRDAPGTADRRSARDSLLPRRTWRLSVDKSYDMTSGMGDITFDGGPDTGMQDVAMADGQDAAAADGQRTPRATSPVPNPMLDQVDVTPLTSHHLAPHLTSPAAGPDGADAQPPKKKTKHQLVDRFTELAAADHLPSSLNAVADQQSTLSIHL